MQRNQRLAFLGLAVVVAVIAIIAISSSGGDDNKSSGNGAYTVTVKDAKPEGGIQKLKYSKGDILDLTIKSDTADEIHIHGYDQHKDVEAGGQVHFSFPLKDDGVFEIELEDHKQQIASLVVQ